MQGYNALAMRSKLLHVGDRVHVGLIASVPPLNRVFAGTIADTDEYGLLVECEGERAVFVPWSNVAAVTKVP